MSDYADIDREFQNYQDRIADLEFEVEHERYNVEKTAQEAAKRIKALEAALREIKQLALSCKPAETPAALAHMVRICIDAGIARIALAPVEEDDETIARRLAIIFHGDDVEWKGFLTKAHHWMSLSIDAADKRAQAHECSSADTGDVKFSFAWDLNEVLCEVIEGGADESRVISAKVAAHPKMKKWLDVAPRLPTEPQGAGK